MLLKIRYSSVGRRMRRVVLLFQEVRDVKMRRFRTIFVNLSI